ncbi:MAG: DNA-binding response regulator [Betaproteobacteria bacterium]|nr:DNA-binding response regulator [Betaproteobacteria bacterium]NBY14314.1 DNA-binding response regulator [Betaproteobacteria bacterium]
MSDSIARLLAAHHAHQQTPDAQPIRVPSEALGTSLSSGNRRSLKPGGTAVIRVEVRDAAQEASPWAALTPRQFEVLGYLVEGKPTKTICRCLGMSEGTAKVHISAILRALNVRNRAEVVVAAFRAGWAQAVVDRRS